MQTFLPDGSSDLASFRIDERGHFLALDLIFINCYFTLDSDIILKEYVFIRSSIRIYTASVTLALEASVPRKCSPKLNKFLLASVCISTTGPHRMALQLWSEKLFGEAHRGDFIGFMLAVGLPEHNCCLQSRLCLWLRESPQAEMLSGREGQRLLSHLFR